MITFTIDDLPSTFARILEVDDQQERQEIIACVHSVWEQASYNPHVLSNIGLDAWATHCANRCDHDELLVYLRQLRMEMLENASIYEQYHAEVDPEEAFEGFIEGNSIQEDVYTLFVEENDPDEISDIAADNACELFRRLYGISMTESQQLDTLDFIRDLVDQEFQNFRYYEEEPIMTANYKNNTNKSHFIETVQLALADQAVLDELKNNYYAFAASDHNAVTPDGMMSFASEWINTVIDNYPNFKDVSESEHLEVEEWIIREILYPISEDIKKTQGTFEDETFEPETFEPEKADPEETTGFMSANCKINTRFLETARRMLSNQATIDELKNAYHASAAQDPNARTTDGMQSFAMEWINKIIDNDSSLKDVSESEIHIVKWWIIDKILFPIALHIDMDQEAKKLKEARKKSNVFVTLGSKAKKGIKRAIAAIRKALTTIGNAIKNAAIKTGRKACDIANTVYSNWFIREGVCFLESLLIGTAVGRIAVRIMRALNVVSGTARFFIIFFGSAIIAGLLAEFVNWLNDKILSAMARKSEKY